MYLEKKIQIEFTKEEKEIIERFITFLKILKKRAVNI